jgi:hypothetical protein
VKQSTAKRPSAIVKAVEVKPTAGIKASEIFAATAGEVGKAVLLNTLIPHIKNLLLDAANTALNTLFNTSGGGQRLGNYGLSGERTSYGTMYRQGTGPVVDAQWKPASLRPRTDYKLIELTSREDAEAVLHEMRARIAEFGAVTVRDFLDLVGKTSDDITDSGRGWCKLDGAHVEVIGLNKFRIDFGSVPTNLR